METRAESKLARIREVILREWLLEVVTPCSQVGVGIRLEVPKRGIADK